MSFDKTPTSWFESWSEDGTTISVPLTTFPEMTAAEADATTGDIRKIMFAIIQKFYSVYLATASADRPTKFTITKTATTDMIRGVLKNRYVIACETDISAQEVREETSNTPSHTVSATPSSTPSNTVSHTPSRTPSQTPSHTVSNTPSQTPSHTSSPSHTVSATPSHTVSRTPSQTPSHTSS